ncbi:MAG: bis-aminopropyl spermidine synthase family protein, partial [Candidatus Freyarchaeota archaeon]|nr:bis-aminopropyl spermidine synthase family protein [Candidatus Jordarchaeia archaeon]
MTSIAKLEINKNFLASMVKECKKKNPKDPNITSYEISRIIFQLREGRILSNIVSRMQVASVMTVLGYLHYKDLLTYNHNTGVFKLRRAPVWNLKSFTQIQYQVLREALPKENLLNQILKKRNLELISEYAQLFINLETLLRKFTLMQSYNDVEGKDIIFVGDDDLLSVFTALLGEANQITVLDVDERILSLIERLSKENDLNIETLKHDLMHPLPPTLQNKFDTFVTDSSHCLGGIMLFVSRGISSLKKGIETAGYFNFQTVDEEPIMSFQIRRRIFEYLINTMKVVVSCAIPSFVNYIIPVQENKMLTEKLIEALRAPNFDQFKPLSAYRDASTFIEFYPYFTMEPVTIVRINCLDSEPLIKGEFDEESEKKLGPIYSWKYLKE